jgi:hypothetical protein
MLKYYFRYMFPTKERCITLETTEKEGGRRMLTLHSSEFGNETGKTQTLKESNS